MTSKADFTEEEWTRLKRAPFVAGMAISLADPGGPIEAFKETSATLKTVIAAAEGSDGGDLVGEIAREVGGRLPHRKNPLADFKPRGATAGVEILDEIRDVGRIASEKATPEEAAALRDVVAGGGAGRRGRREGRRLHGIPCRARQRGRAGDARQARRRARGALRLAWIQA